MASAHFSVFDKLRFKFRMLLFWRWRKFDGNVDVIDVFKASVTSMFGTPIDIFTSAALSLTLSLFGEQDQKSFISFLTDTVAYVALEVAYLRWKHRCIDGSLFLDHRSF